MASMVTSRLTNKPRTTLPKPVRSALGLRMGDEIAYAIEQGWVVLTRVGSGRAAEDLIGTFSEWDSPADTAAYAGL